MSARVAGIATIKQTASIGFCERGVIGVPAIKSETVVIRRPIRLDESCVVTNRRARHTVNVSTPGVSLGGTAATALHPSHVHGIVLIVFAIGRANELKTNLGQGKHAPHALVAIGITWR